MADRCLRLLPILVCLALVILTTCGKDSPTKPKPPEPPPPVTPVATRIEITPSSAKLNSLGQTVQLTARVFDQNNNAMAGATVTWFSSDVSVAGVNTQGLVTAVKNGTTVITARSSNASATANVTVSQSAGSIAIAPQMATLMSIGETVQLTATVLDGNGQPVAGAVVTWTSSDESVATVSAQGLVTAFKNGFARITATSGDGIAGVDVTVMQSAGSIVIAPMEATLMSLGATVQLTATVLDGNGQPVAGVEVTWQSSDESVATVSAQGLVTAVRNGTARVMATSGAATSGIEVTVMQSAGSIVIAPMEATLMSLGATVQLEATVLDQNGQPVEGAVVSWQSSDDGIATVSAEGQVMAVKNGVTRITATSGSASSGVDVTVMQSAGSIVIAPMEATLMSLGATVQLTATVLDDHGQPVVDAVVTWQSVDDAVATVSAQGLVTAVANGVARVTARSGSASAGIDVTVMQSAGSIVIAPMEATLMSLGATVQLTATVLDGNGQPVEGAVVTWQSSDESVATVSVQGLVTAVTNGVVRITATSGSATSGIDVTVMQSAGSIVIEPEEATLMAIGGTVQLTATVLDDNGQPVEGAVVTWQSSDESVATVSVQGLVTAETNGVVHITATSGSATSGIDVTVMQSAGSIVIEPEEATLMSLGATVQLTATVLDGNGQPVAGAVVTWTSSDKSVATVSAQGLVTAEMNGTARIMATSDTATAGINVKVMQSAGSIVIAPMEATLMSLGATVQLTATVLDQNGQSVEDAVVTWQSSDESVATVSADGLVTAVGNGVVRITATSGSASTGIDVTVMQSAGSMVIEPEMSTLMSLGETVQLEATVLDGNGQPVAGAVVTWESGDEAVATVSAQGLVTAVSNGVARITATSGIATAGIDVTVLQSAGSIVIAPMEATLMSLGASVQLSVTVLDGNGQPVSGAVVTWQSSDEAVATVSTQGLVTAVNNGSVRITATSGSASAGIDVTVLQSAGSIVIAPEMATLMSLGETVQLEATVLDGNGQLVSGAVVMWQSSDEAVATVSAEGLVTAVRNGTARITARSGSASQGIDVTVIQSAGSIVIAPDEATLMSLGATVQLTATVLDQNGQSVEDAVVTWQSGDESVATVNAQGLVTAVGNGVARITARSGSASQGIDVTVMQSAGSIVIAPDEATLMSLGATVQLTATVLDQNGQSVEDAVVTWQSGDESVATVNAQGLVTAVGNGVARITATSGSVSSGIDVSVMQSAGSIVIVPMEVTLMSLGATVHLRATVLDGNGQPVAGAVVIWQSGDESVATVSAQGLVTAVSNGVARITATSGGATAGVDVTVMQSAGSIVIAPEMATLMSLGETVQLTATVLDGNGQPVDGAVVIWQSSDEAVATVSSQGLVTAVSNGVARITVTSGGASSGVDVTVMQSAGSIVIAPEEATLMSLGETVQLTAAVLDQNGQPVAGAEVRWESSDESVATVNAQGLVAAAGNGVTRIWAASGGVMSSIAVTVQIRIPSPDRDVLVALYNALDGPNWTNNSNWLTQRHVDEWYGVHTDEEGRVTALNLGGNNLNGTMTAQLAELSHLEGLSLEDNQLTGVIPQEMGGLDNLTLLYLFGNQLTGVIPPELGQMQNLIHLCLNNNRLSGVIPPELGQLRNLKWLHLHNNANLTGALPVELVALDLDALLLQGTQVCLTDDTDLERWLSEISDARVAQCEELNNLDRNVLKALYNATNGPGWRNNTNWLSDAPLENWSGVKTDEGGRVVRLELNGNNLGGTLPPELGQLTNLTHLSLVNNQLTGNILPELGHLRSLTELDLSKNLLSGSIPAEFGQMTNLVRLHVYSNRLSGSIPSEIGQLKSLSSIALFGNQLTGSIPPEIGQLSQLAELNLYINQLSGSIPSELGQLANLNTLALFRNQLMGSIPSELGQMSSLTELSLTQNQLTGSIPAELGQLANLNLLALDYNKLSGGIPTALGRLVNLASLYLSGNQLSGNVPPELGKLVNLDRLVLASNPNLSGSLPNQLTALDLISLDLAESSVCVPSTTKFREWIGTIQYPRVIFCNPDRDPLVALYHATGGENWNSDANWLSYKTLDHWFGVTTNSEGRVVELNLENNNLVGKLPEELALLSDLHELNVGNNPSLIGSLPRSILGLSLRTLKLDGSGICAPVDIEFQTWLLNVTNRSGVISCEELMLLDDRGVLVKFFNSTDGPNWKIKSNWLSDVPIEEWYGVTTDSEGRVLELNFVNNNIHGPIIPELGQLTKLTTMNFFANQVTGVIPPELGHLANLAEFVCSGCQLTGSIPPELGQLTRLTHLILFANRLTGNIPPELGQLANLIELNIRNNLLTGGIPPELGQIENLTHMVLGGNILLKGVIPPELGQLSELELLDCIGCRLTGSIPPELGQLTNLRELRLSENFLTGSIPDELGQLENLTRLILRRNKLESRIPGELGRSTNLVEIDLSNNELSGELPDELGDLVNLRSLRLNGNYELTGAIPVPMINLGLTELSFDNTQLCAPSDSSFMTWYQGINTRSYIVRCRSQSVMNPELYLTQAVQSFKHPVPLVEDEPALMRVFFSTEEVVLNKPAVKANFFLNGNEVHSVNISSGPAKIPLQTDESSLEISANALVPREVIRPGLEVVVEVDHGSRPDPESGISIRVPETGRIPIDVRSVPTFHLTLIPLLWIENPDYSVVTNSESLMEDDRLFQFTKDLLPINDFKIALHMPVWTAYEPAFFNSEVINEIRVIRIMEGSNGYYMGIGTTGGLADQKGFVSFSVLDAKTMAHELGHNLSLSHAPCGFPGGVDPDYPYLDGSIGAWGYDLNRNSLRDPISPDIMGYCGGAWISDYHFKKMMNYRILEEESRLTSESSSQAKNLLIWGGLDEDNDLVLEPAFVVETTPFLPSESGSYRLSGLDTEGNFLFTMSFAMSEIADGDGGGFAFAIPVQKVWSGRLARIMLTGPSGFAIMTRESGRSAAILMDQSTGNVRGVLRDWLKPGTTVRSARRVVPEPGLDIIVSPGIPEAEVWER